MFVKFGLQEGGRKGGERGEKVLQPNYTVCREETGRVWGQMANVILEQDTPRGVMDGFLMLLLF